MMRLASRLDHIEPFYVMEVAKRATDVAATAACDPSRGGRRMVYLNIGEPSETAVAQVQQAAHRVIEAGTTAYTHATGLPELRQALSRWYAQRFQVDIDPARIVITAGASAALQLATLALVEPGDEVLMPDPCYPCNRHFVAAAGGVARQLPSDAARRFQLGADDVQRHWTPRTRGVVLATPSNPTGTSIDAAEMARMVQAVRARGGFTIVDEIYLGLSFESAYGGSALALGEDIIAVNSFSKYFGMTGWRLGWLVLPPAMVGAVEKLAQNLYICASTVAQRAALAGFEPEALAEFERRRGEFKRRRDYIVPQLQRLGLQVPVEPDGAFYVWVDCSAHAASSWDFCMGLIERAQIALAPGRDFGPTHAERFLRLSYAGSMDDLREAVSRLEAVL